MKRYLRRLAPTAILLSAASAVQGCDEWFLEETPANLTMSVVTVALRPSAEEDPSLTEEDASADMERAAKVWKDRCGVTLVHQGHYVADASASGIQYNPSGDAELAAIQSRFYDPHHLAVVYLGDMEYEDETDPLGAEYVTVGLGKYPWAEVPGAILVSAWAVDEVVTGHELGHVFGLEHTDEDDWAGNDEHNLMYPIDLGYSDPKVISAQCERAKEYILTDQVFMLNCRPGAKGEAADTSHNCVAPNASRLGSASSALTSGEPIFQRPARKFKRGAKRHCPPSRLRSS